MSVTTSLPGGIPGVVGRPGGAIDGTEAGEWIFGTETDDIIVAGGGDDLVLALAGSNTIIAGDGNDTVLGGAATDIIEGGPGDDVVSGGAAADTFVFDPSRAEGADVIVDFTPGEGDVLALSAAGLSALGITEFSGAALDLSEDFNIVEDPETGDQVIEHPGGTITLSGVPFPGEGQEAPTFAALEAAGALTTSNLVSGTDAGEELTGTDGDDVIIAGAGDDTVTPGGGNDTITLGDGSDTVNLDPSTPNQGTDVITDFNVEEDKINFALADILAADPNLPAADGDASSLSLADFDANTTDGWGVGQTDGNLHLGYPNGVVVLGNVPAANQTLSSFITIDGQEVTGPIPVGGAPTPPGGEPTPPGGEVPPPAAVAAGGEDTDEGEAEVAEISSPDPTDPTADAIA
jgi:Ca2+-binding RTX toxin-like protein